MSPSKSRDARSQTRAAATGSSTRDAIQDAAVKLFFQHGYSAATVREIASELGISLGNGRLGRSGQPQRGLT